MVCKVYNIVYRPSLGGTATLRATTSTRAGTSGQGETQGIGPGPA